MTTESNPAVLRRELAKYFRDLRHQHGYELEQVAQRLECSAAKVSRLENGSRGLSAADLETLCDLYEIDGAERARLVEMGNESRKRIPVPSLGLPPTFTDWVRMEQAAVAISEYQTSVVPGLLQTRRYATEAVRGYGLGQDPETTRAAVDVRLARQEVLNRPNPPAFWAVMDEAALARAVGGPGTMREQLEHLRLMAERPNVTIQVIPFSAGAHPGLNSDFVLLEFGRPSVPDVVFVEGQAGTFVKDRPEELARYRRLWQQLLAVALPPEQTRRLVADLVHRVR